MAKHYNYTSLPWQKVGLMICGVCHKKITEGQYRYYETRGAYVPQHRACCADDQRWKTIDNEAQVAEEMKRDMLADAIVFRDKWSVDDLDDLIESLSLPPL